MRKLLLLVLAALVLVRTPARAAFEDMPNAARTAALGGSNVADVSQVQESFLNPAALAGVTRYEAYMAYNKEFMGLSDGSSIGRNVIGIAAPFRFGTFALGIDRFSAASLYNENAMSLGFGRQVGKKTWIGLNMRQLSVSYAQDQYTAANPVFKAGSSKSAMGLDLGLVRFGKKSRWALSIVNGNEPDLGIKYSNKVARRVNVGWSYKIADRLTIDPALGLAGSDYRFRFGVESQAPKSGLAWRGGLNVGAKDYRNLSLGFGWRGKSFQLDYSMNFPLSGAPTSVGSHQFGLTARWGRSKRKVASLEGEEGEQAEGEEGQESGEVVKAKPAAPTSDDREKAKDALEQAKKDLAEGKLAAALERLNEADPALVGAAELEETKAMAAKATAVAQIYPDLRGSDQKMRLLRQAVGGYLAGDGKRAVNAATYASQLYPNDQRVGRLRAIVSKAFPLESFELKLLPNVLLTDQKLQESLELIYGGKYTSAVSECKEVLELEPNNVLALVRMGSAYWAMGMKKNARDVWSRALKLDPNNDVLRKFLGAKLEEDVEPEGQPTQTTTAKPEVREEFNSKMAYYERLKRSGADKATLAQILQRIIEKYEGTGVDLTEAYKEYQQVRK